MWAAMSQCCCRQRWFEEPEGLAPEWRLQLVPASPRGSFPGIEAEAPQPEVEAPTRVAAPASVEVCRVAADDDVVKDAPLALAAIKHDEEVDRMSDAVSTLASLPAPATSPRGEASSPCSVSACSDVDSCSQAGADATAAAEFASKLGIAQEDLYRMF